MIGDTRSPTPRWSHNPSLWTISITNLTSVVQLISWEYSADSSTINGNKTTKLPSNTSIKSREVPRFGFYFIWLASHWHSLSFGSSCPSRQGNSGVPWLRLFTILSTESSSLLGSISAYLLVCLDVVMIRQDTFWGIGYLDRLLRSLFAYISCTWLSSSVELIPAKWIFIGSLSQLLASQSQISSGPLLPLLVSPC